MTLLLQYSDSQRDADGTPWIDENMHPDTGVWLARENLRGIPDYHLKDRGRHYNHSTFIDLVMTGLCGIRPTEGKELVIRPLGTSLDWFRVTRVPYHGRSLDIEWKKNEGLRVSVDGQERASVSSAEEAETVIVL